jgi:hypothetical protein
MRSEPNSQNGNPSKINLEKWHVFRARKLTVTLPAFTSNPPQITIKKTRSDTHFFQKPQQERGKPAPKKSLQKRYIFYGDFANSNSR